MNQLIYTLVLETVINTIVYICTYQISESDQISISYYFYLDLYTEHKCNQNNINLKLQQLET